MTSFVVIVTALIAVAVYFGSVYAQQGRAGVDRIVERTGAWLPVTVVGAILLALLITVPKIQLWWR